MIKAAPERRLSNHERGFQDLDTPERIQIVSGVIFLSANIRREIIWERVRDFIELNPLYRCRIVRSRDPEWKEDHSFVLANHCDEIALGDSTDEQVLTFISNAAARGLAIDQPPWRIVLLRLEADCEQQARNAIAIIAHHSLLDGLQGLKFFGCLIDRTEKPSTKEQHATGSSDFPISKTPAISTSCVRYVAGESLRRRSIGPFTSHDAGSAKRTTLAFTWTRKSFISARRNCDATFQEVLLTALTDALDRYSRSRGLKRNLRAILPMARPEDHPLSFKTNRHDVGYIELPTRSAHSSRHCKIRRNLESLRREQEHETFSSILAFMGRLPNAMRKAVAHRLVNQADLLISLIPGGRSNVTIDGAEVTSRFAQPALPPRHSLVVGIMVTRRKVCVTVQIDPACIDRAEELRACFEHAYRRTVLEEATVDVMVRTKTVPRSPNAAQSQRPAFWGSLGSLLRALRAKLFHSPGTDAR